MKRLGVCIRNEVEPTEGLPTYDDVMLFYNDLAAETQQRIRELDWSPLLDDRTFEVTSRPKTVDTLRQKLQRDHSTPLPSIQDIAGVRFEAEMSLDEQDAVVNAVAGLFGHDSSCIRDLRSDPHSGYRAVHLWLRLPARVEVQVRTHLQGAWANMYESLADVVGREIRYGVMPEDPELLQIVKTLQDMSLGRIRELEETRNEILSREADIEVGRTALAESPTGKTIDPMLVDAVARGEASVKELREAVRREEEAVQTSMVALKSAFDKLRSTRR